MTSKEVEQAIRALGLAVTRVDGKWRINYRGGKEATAYYTTDDDDALGMASLVSVAKLVDFERGQVSYGEFMGITELRWG
ncbi:MAG TPA: hypothetical protein VK687_10970 [Bryobacteraceae bacterium]|jgi:hypothetical protein|nr:hypothetical protein [Bryobacteraceae bacterium]